MLIHVAAPDILANQAFREPHSTLPTVALLGGAAQLLPVELEVGLADLLGEHAGAGAQDVPRGPQLPVRQGLAAQHAVQVRGKRRHHVDDFAGETGGAQKRAHQRRHLLECGGVVRSHRVARLDHVPVARGQLRLQVDYALGGDLRGQALQVLRFEETEHLLHVSLVRGEGFGVVLVAVVGLVRQAQAGLENVGHGLLALRVLLHPVAHRPADADALQLSKAADEFVDVCDLDLGQVGVKGADVAGVVHEGLEQSAAETGAVLQDGVDVFFRFVAQDVERAVDAAVSGDFVGVDPRAVYKLKEVIHAPTLREFGWGLGTVR